jgi:hypothetical protein
VMLRLTKGMGATPLRRHRSPALRALGERATAAPRGWRGWIPRSNLLKEVTQTASELPTW